MAIDPLPRKESIVNVTRVAAKAEQGFSCSEAMLICYGKRYGLNEKTAIPLASGFSGGMGLMGETCGAVTSAFMIIGLEFGPSSLEDNFARQNSLMLVSEFAERFKLRFGSILCRELCGSHHLINPESAMALRKSGLPARIIQDSARLLENIIREN